ncbi:MAG: hypothetical protein JXN59_05540, partial [Anaerolineae bacterium]|nr:hypothetical protein [Anaerolineae bacterium]
STIRMAKPARTFITVLLFIITCWMRRPGEIKADCTGQTIQFQAGMPEQKTLLKKCLMVRRFRQLQ